MMRLSDLKPASQVLEDDYRDDPKFRAEWDRTAFARDVALRIVSYRREHGLTQSALARSVGMTQSVIARLEAGDQPPSISTLAKLSAGTGLDFGLAIKNGAVELLDAAEPAVVVEFKIDFLVAFDGTDAAFRAHGDRVLEALVELETCNDNVSDAAVDVDAAEKAITISVLVAGDSEPETLGVALTVIRTAIHKVGGSTPMWPTVDDVIKPDSVEHRLRRLQQTGRRVDA